MDNLKNIYQIYYNEEGRKKCLPEFSLHDNSGKLSVLFENQVILDRYQEWDGSDWFGVLSWRFLSKLPNQRITAQALSSRLASTDSDVFSFFHADKSKRHYFQKMDMWHKNLNPSMLDILEKLVRHLGLPVDVRGKNKPGTWIHCNYVIARRTYWRKYMPYLVQACKYLELCEEAYQDPHYPPRGISGTMANKLEREIGYRHYTLIPFILERLHTVILNYYDFTIEHYH